MTQSLWSSHFLFDDTLFVLFIYLLLTPVIIINWIATEEVHNSVRPLYIWDLRSAIYFLTPSFHCVWAGLSFCYSEVAQFYALKKSEASFGAQLFFGLFFFTNSISYSSFWASFFILHSRRFFFAWVQYYTIQFTFRPLHVSTTIHRIVSQGGIHLRIKSLFSFSPVPL